MTASESVIQEVCDCLYEGDLILMKRLYERALKKAKTKRVRLDQELKQVLLFERDLKIIKKMLNN